MNETITAPLKNLFMNLDVAAVDVANLKRYDKQSDQKDDPGDWLPYSKRYRKPLY